MIAQDPGRRDRERGTRVGRHEETKAAQLTNDEGVLLERNVGALHAWDLSGVRHVGSGVLSEVYPRGMAMMGCDGKDREQVRRMKERGGPREEGGRGAREERSR